MSLATVQTFKLRMIAGVRGVKLSTWAWCHIEPTSFLLGMRPTLRGQTVALCPTKGAMYSGPDMLHVRASHPRDRQLNSVGKPRFHLACALCFFLAGAAVRFPALSGRKEIRRRPSI